MSKVVTTTVLPDVAGGSVTLGGTGDSVVVTGNDIRTNALQDTGGIAIFTSDGSGSITSLGFPGALNLISTSTASSVANLSITSGLNSTYDVYIFKLFNIHAVTTDDGVNLTFQTSTDGGSTYGVTATTTYFGADYNESGGNSHYLQYIGSGDLAQGTGYQRLTQALGNVADEGTSGQIYLFAPSSTTYIKNFYTRCQGYGFGNTADDMYAGGYFNTTSAINAIDFKMTAGTFSGTIKLYGISKS